MKIYLFTKDKEHILPTLKTRLEHQQHAHQVYNIEGFEWLHNQGALNTNDFLIKHF